MFIPAFPFTRLPTLTHSLTHPPTPQCMLNFLMDVIRALSVLVCRICIDPMSLSSFINESTPYMQTLFDNTKNTSQNAPTSKNPTHQNQNQNPHIDGKAKTQQPSNPYAYPPPSILNPVHLHLSHPLTPQSIQKVSGRSERALMKTRILAMNQHQRNGCLLMANSTPVTNI